MKKFANLCLVLSLLLFTKNGASQTSISIFGGINHSDDQFDVSNLHHYKGIYNPQVGMEVGFEIGSKINLNLIAQYSTRGFKNDDGLEIIRWRYSFIDVISELAYNFNSRVGIGIGAYAGLKTNEETMLRNQEWIQTKNEDIINQYDYGFELMFKYSFEKIYIKLRYLYGLHEQEGRFTDFRLTEWDVNYTFEVIGISLGYKL